MYIKHNSLIVLLNLELNQELGHCTSVTHDNQSITDLEVNRNLYKVNVQYVLYSSLN